MAFVDCDNYRNSVDNRQYTDLLSGKRYIRDQCLENRELVVFEKTCRGRGDRGERL